MNWKNLPAWLKGGIIGVVVYLCVGIFSDLIMFAPNGAAIEDALEQALSTIYLQNNLIFGVIGTIYAVLGWFVAGALIGLIIQIAKKIKARKEVNK
jgi:hypothetical protein